MRFRHVLAVVLLSSVSGCVELQPHVEKTAALDPGAGYVAGFFTWPGGVATFALLVSDAPGHEHALPFRDLRADGQVSGAGIQMIALPPGDYRVASWTYNALHPPPANEVPRTARLGRPFALRPGHVVFLGAVSARLSTERGLAPENEIAEVPMRADEARRLFARAYPGFAAAPMECLACAAPAPDATEAAAPALPDAGDFAPSHTIVAHLHASDRYAQYELTAWDGADGAAERRWATRASPGRPLLRQRLDAFGSVWELTDLEFRSGRVHVVTRGPLRAAEERSWDLARGHEVWLNEGDPEVHFTRAEACAAQAR